MLQGPFYAFLLGTLEFNLLCCKAIDVKCIVHCQQEDSKASISMGNTYFFTQVPPFKKHQSNHNRTSRLNFGCNGSRHFIQNQPILTVPTLWSKNAFVMVLVHTERSFSC